jgi:hypothetical protein
VRNSLLPVAFLLAVLSLASCGDDDGAPPETPTPPATATPSTSPTVSPDATASPAPSPVLGELTLGEPIEVPDSQAFLVETGCWGCDGPMQTLTRIYRDPAGAVRTDVLFDPVARGLHRTTSNPADEGPPTISGFYSEPDGSFMAVSVCVNEACGYGGLEFWHGESESVVFTSTDGGLTWTEIGRVGPVGSVIGYAGGQVIALSTDAPVAIPNAVTVPGGEVIAAPAGGQWPLTAFGVLLRRTDDGRLLHTDGTEFAAFDYEGEEFWVDSVLGSGNDTKGSALVTWVDQLPFTGIHHLSVLDFSEAAPVAVTSVWSDLLVYPAWWSPKDMIALATIDVHLPEPLGGIGGPYITQVDLETGDFRPVNTGVNLGRNLLQAVQAGPFARVSGTNSCLNVRAEPSATGQVLACMADGVLLTDSGESQTTDGVTWVRVTTPTHVQGWSAATYLER